MTSPNNELEPEFLATALTLGYIPPAVDEEQDAD